MSLPGPSGLTWALELLALAAAFLPVGELLRRLAARWVSLFRDLSGVERLLLDLYLGGGGLYLLAALPFGWFSLPLVVAYLVAGAIGLLAFVVRSGLPALRPAPNHGPRTLGRFAPAGLVVLATLVLYGIEVGVASGVPTGNSYDTSLLVDYVSLLLRHHEIPTSLSPIAPEFTSYPQGTTVWIAAAQLIFSLPPARSPLLVTPLFLSLSPLAAYVVGRRLLGTPWAGAILGLTFALLGSWTRVMVATSNDFVVSFPLVLWLLARVGVWRTGRPPGWADALAWGALLGYSAALNPVGAEWLFPTIVLLGLFAYNRSLATLASALTRWGAALVAALVFVVPSIWAAVEGGGALFSSTGGVVVPASTTPPGISFAQFVGAVDPFLFGPHAIWLSPFVALRFELALLLLVAAGMALLPSLRGWVGAGGRSFLEVAGAAIVVAVAILLMEVATHAGVPVLNGLALSSSPQEVSVDLFTIYTAIAAIPLVVVLNAALGGRAEGRSTGGAGADLDPPPARRHWTGSQTVALALVLALLVPGVVVTGTDFPPYLQQLYGSYGRVTSADFAMFAWASHGLPAGARVLVAPGSAAQFLPGYANVALIFPVQRIAHNESYVNLDAELVAGNLTAAGIQDLHWLGVQYIAVTGNTTDLWAPFSPAPLLADPTLFTPIFAQGDAYVFQLAG